MTNANVEQQGQNSNVKRKRQTKVLMLVVVNHIERQL